MGPQRQPDRTFSARHGLTFYARACALILLLLLAPVGRRRRANRVLRARSASCGLSRRAYPPLRESRSLDKIASLIARGEPLEQAQQRAGYHAARSLSIRISGTTSDAAVERLVSRRFCSQLADPSLRQIGVYGSGVGSLWIVVAAPFTTPRPGDAAALTNEARAHARTCGWQHFPPAPPLALAPDLTRAARGHSQDMAAHGFFSHSGSDGSTPGERVARAGYRWSMVGENIASGVPTARAVVAGWLGSPHHCANIMTAGFRQMGVAYAIDGANSQVITWTEDFGTPLIQARRPRRAGARGR